MNKLKQFSKIWFLSKHISLSASFQHLVKCKGQLELNFLMWPPARLWLSTLCLRNAARVLLFPKNTSPCRCLESEGCSVTPAVTGRGVIFFFPLFFKYAAYWLGSPTRIKLHSPPACYCMCFHPRVETSLADRGRGKRWGSVCVCVCVSSLSLSLSLGSWRE